METEPIEPKAQSQSISILAFVFRYCGCCCQLRNWPCVSFTGGNHWFSLHNSIYLSAEFSATHKSIIKERILLRDEKFCFQYFTHNSSSSSSSWHFQCRSSPGDPQTASNASVSLWSSCHRATYLITSPWYAPGTPCGAGRTEDNLCDCFLSGAKPPWQRDYLCILMFTWVTITFHLNAD